MKRPIFLFLFLLFFMILPGCADSEEPADTSAAAVETTVPATEATPETFPTEAETTPPTIPTEPLPEFSEEEKQMLLKIAMAERGNCGCTECIALIMCTVRNRAESGRFGSSIRSVLFAPDQFTPVSDGSYYNAKPNENCYDAYDLIRSGWDESQGALYYEWCEGESWHSKNLHLLFQHCGIRFYD